MIMLFKKMISIYYQSHIGSLGLRNIVWHNHKLILIEEFIIFEEEKGIMDL